MKINFRKINGNISARRQKELDTDERTDQMKRWVIYNVLSHLFKTETNVGTQGIANAVETKFSKVTAVIEWLVKTHYLEELEMIYDDDDNILPNIVIHDVE